MLLSLLRIRVEVRFQTLHPAKIGFLKTWYTAPCNHFLPKWVMPRSLRLKAIERQLRPSRAIENIERTHSTSLAGHGISVTRSVFRLFCSLRSNVCLGLPSPDSIRRR